MDGGEPTREMLPWHPAFQLFACKGLKRQTGVRGGQRKQDPFPWTKITPDVGTDEMVISQFSGGLQLRHGRTSRVLEGVLQLLGIDGVLELNSVGDE